MASDFFSHMLGDRQTVGIDIGHYSIKLVRVFHSHRGNIQVTAVDLERLPEKTLEDGEIRDAEKLRDALSKIMARQVGDREKVDIVAGINSASGVLVDKLTVKVPKNGNEDAIIVQTAQARPPFDDQDNILDYQVYDRQEGEIKVNIVAAKNAMLDSWAGLYKDADIRLNAIDVDVFALANVYMSSVEEEEKKKTVAIFNIGEKKASIVFLMEGFFHSTRALTSGSMESVINMLCRHLGIDAAKCHEMFESEKPVMIDGFSEADVESAMQLAFEEVVGALEFGIRYFSNSESGEKPSKILLSGGGVSLPGICEYIEDRIGIPTEALNPFEKVSCSPEVVGESGLSKALVNIYAPALGYAMRKF